MNKILGTIAAVCLFFGLAGQAVAQSPAGNEDLAGQIRQALKDNPDMVLDVMRAHGDVLLDVLQEASVQRQRLIQQNQWEEDLKQPKNVQLENRPARGSETAPITMVAFSDFTCAYCQQAAITIENLLNRYPDQIRFVFKQIPATDTGKTAARWFQSAYQMDEAQAWIFYALLFDRQRALAADPLTTLRTAATMAGLDAATLESNVSENIQTLDEFLNVDSTEAKDLGFYGTPYFLVNDLVVRGALPLETFVEAVELALKTER